MDATTCSAPPQQPHYNAGPRPPNAAPHGAPHGAPRFENQNKPFFFVQPAQSYMPMQGLQWPMPMPYNPYFGYPGYPGYGVPVMSPYQSNPYLEPPGYVVPHTHLHLMDYRRLLNPHYYQTMAYHSRRFRYQHNSSSKETTSSEVQTEPFGVSNRSNNPAVSPDVRSSSVVQVNGSDNSLGVASGEPTSPTSPTSAVQKADRSVELKERTPPSNGSFVIQTEEVRIECCSTPVGLQLLHESAEVSHTIKCDSIVQTSSLPDDQSQQVRPDVLLVGRSVTEETVPALEDSEIQTSIFDRKEEPTEKDPPSTDSQFKVVNLLFQSKPPDALREDQSCFWSMEETVVTAPVQNSSSESQDETLIAETSEILMLNEEVLIEVPVDGQEDMEVSLEASRLVLVSNVEERPLMDALVPEELERSPLAEVVTASYSVLSERLAIRAENGNHQKPETNTEDNQDTSFESLPAYLPSTTWLADFDKLYYRTAIPAAPRKQFRSPSRSVINVPSRRRKLDMEAKDHPCLRKPKEKYKSRGKLESRSLSDHEYCLNRSENVLDLCASNREQLCSRCVEKCGPSTGPDLSFKRKSSFFNQWIDGVLPTCGTCKSHAKRRPARKCSKGAFQRRGMDTEGESSENGSCSTSKWKLVDAKRPLASKQNLEKCPVVTNSSLKEKNCLCSETHLQPRPLPQRNAGREMDENFAAPVSLQERWRNQAYAANRLQTERFWKSSTLDADVSGTFGGSPLSNKHKKSQTHSQESRRKDTRC